MFDIPFYQTNWHGINLLDIAKKVCLNKNELPGASFYEKFYKLLEENKVLLSSDWVDKKKQLAIEIKNILTKYYNKDNIILSVGSGFGIVELELIKAGFNIDLQECQEYSLQHITDRQNLKIIISNDLSEIPSDHYDIVMAITSTYCLNLQTLGQFLSAISRVIKKDGILIWYETSLTYYDIFGSVKMLVYNKLKGVDAIGVLWGWKRSMSAQKKTAIKNKLHPLEQLYFDKNNSIIKPNLVFNMPLDQKVAWQLGIYKNLK